LKYKVSVNEDKIEQLLDTASFLGKIVSTNVVIGGNTSLYKRCRRREIFIKKSNV